MKESEDDTNKCKNTPFSWIGSINISKMTILPKEIYRFNATPIKTPMYFSQNQNKSKICNGNTKLQIAKTNLRKKNKDGGNTLADFNLYYQDTGIKTIWY